jgi:glycosyltransferase involved in cell wall biosynthesis
LSTLMVIASEAVSEWLAKGEILDRYYNPGDVFDRVELVLTNHDRPDPALVAQLAGRAEIGIHNVPPPRGLFRRSLGYRPRLLRPWTRQVVELARSLRPDVVRCYGANLNVAAAAAIRAELGVPYAVSLHINPDEDVRRRVRGREGVVATMLRAVEAHGLRSADLVLPVYRPIVPYLERLGVERYRVAYNVVDGANIERKTDYALHNPVRVISVGRQFEAKNPERLIRAIGLLHGVQLTLVGDGPLHDHLRVVAASTGSPERFVFHRALANAELCRLLATQDIFATHTEFWEVSKALIEALLTGLPAVINRRRGEPVPELEDGRVLLVDDDADAWRAALSELIRDSEARAALARRGSESAWREWSPAVTERTFAEIYRELAGAPSAVAP